LFLIKATKTLGTPLWEMVTPVVQDYEHRTLTLHDVGVGHTDKEVGLHVSPVQLNAEETVPDDASDVQLEIRLKATIQY